MIQFPITAGFLSGAPTDLIADSLSLGDRWTIGYPASRRSAVEVNLSRFGTKLGLMAFWIGPAVES